MSRPYKFLLFLAVLSLSCGLISGPISDAKNLAATAEALATANPIQTIRAMPSAIPDVGQFLNPQGAPLAEWKGIPVMPQATTGQEFNQKTYSFKAKATISDVQNFYNDKLKGLGWAQPFSLPSGTDIGVMVFQKDSNILSIIITPTGDEAVVVLSLE